LRFFVAGIMQGSRKDDDICDQDYRTTIRGIIARQYPDAEVICPLELFPDSVGYGYEEGKQTFLELAARAAEADVLVSYLPEASMGSSIEMWHAYSAGARILTISPMADNWVIKFLSDRVFSTTEQFGEFLAGGGLAELMGRAESSRTGAGGRPRRLPEEEVGDLLSQRGLTLAVAESCTGGLLGHRITNVSGSSAYFEGGVLSYSNEAKEQILGVPRETLVGHGAVSGETALAMARGARRLFGTDIAVSLTGIAGPTGGTPEKPVGLLYIALAAEDAELLEEHVWSGDRASNKEQSAQAALELLLKYLAA
jgi:PncC family amidohydrolase